MSRLLVFLLVHIAPGDPISAILPPEAPQELVVKLKAYYGFDKPLPIQFLRWLLVVLGGDLGTSVATGRPVAGEIGRALTNTLILADQRLDPRLLRWRRSLGPSPPTLGGGSSTGS